MLAHRQNLRRNSHDPSLQTGSISACCSVEAQQLELAQSQGECVTLKVHVALVSAELSATKHAVVGLTLEHQDTQMQVRKVVDAEADEQPNILAVAVGLAPRNWHLGRGVDQPPPGLLRAAPALPRAPNLGPYLCLMGPRLVYGT